MSAFLAGRVLRAGRGPLTLNGLRGSKNYSMAMHLHTRLLWRQPVMTRNLSMSSKAPAATPTAPIPEKAADTEAVTSVADTASSSASDAVSTAAEAASNTPDAVAPILDVVSQAASIPPLQLGDLASLGLAGWSPAGIIRWSFELINVGTGLPWFWTLVAGATFWRLVVAPFTVESIRNSARLLPHTDKVKALNEERRLASAARDTLGMQRIMLKQKSIYDEAGVSMGRMALTPFVQLPVTLGMFFGVKKMCELPLEQLKWSGVEFLPDLTVADPTYILPIALTAVINFQITAGARDMNLAERPEMGHIMNGLRLLSVAGIYVLTGLPSGLQLTLFVSSLMTGLQSYILRQPAVRRALDIPILPPHLQGRLPSYKESWAWIKGYYGKKMEEAQMRATQDRKIREAARNKVRR